MSEPTSLRDALEKHLLQGSTLPNTKHLPEEVTVRTDANGYFDQVHGVDITYRTRVVAVWPDGGITHEIVETEQWDEKGYQNDPTTTTVQAKIRIRFHGVITNIWLQGSGIKIARVE